MKLVFLLLVVLCVIGCSEADKEQIVEILPFGTVPGDDDSGDDFNIPHNPHTGYIKKYDWGDVKLGFAEPDDYPYGFDRSALKDVSPEGDRYVYISTAEGENAFFKAEFSNETYDNYRLVNDTSGQEIFATNEDVVYIPAGDYSLYGKIKDSDTWIDLDKHVKVIQYGPKSKEVYYMQIDGDGVDLENENFFTYDRIKDAFNKVYRQVLITSDRIYPRAATYYNNESIGLDFNKMLQINMMYPSTEIYLSVYNQAATAVLKQVEGIEAKDIVVKNLHERHVVFAVNKSLKYWPLKVLKTLDIDDLGFFTLYANFFPSMEPEGTTYAIQSIGNCEGGVGPNPISVTIKAIPDKRSDGTEYVKYVAYHNGLPVSFGSCDYLYTTNGLPALPIDAPGALAISKPIVKDKFRLGSVVWVPHGIGPSSFYTVMHELGHSFGLTDVSQGELYADEESGHYLAYSETPLMTWRQPSGWKLRYRNVQVVYTGGAKMDDGSVIECPIMDAFDNQWKCLRDECDTYERWISSSPIMTFFTKYAPNNCVEE